jgi:hypothetical protein
MIWIKDCAVARTDYIFPRRVKLYLAAGVSADWTVSNKLTVIQMDEKNGAEGQVIIDRRSVRWNVRSVCDRLGSEIGGRVTDGTNGVSRVVENWSS